VAEAVHVDPSSSSSSSSSSSFSPQQAELEGWLRATELHEFHLGMQDMGYTSLRYLQEAEQEDIETMISELKMKRPQAK
jgi:hypothetical protein